MGEEFLELVDVRDLLMVDGFWSIFYCTGDKFDSMDDAIAIANCGLGEVVMHKLNSVRKKE